MCVKAILVVGSGQSWLPCRVEGVSTDLSTPTPPAGRKGHGSLRMWPPGMGRGCTGDLERLRKDVQPRQVRAGDGASYCRAHFKFRGHGRCSITWAWSEDGLMYGFVVFRDSEGRGHTAEAGCPYTFLSLCGEMAKVHTFLTLLAGMGAGWAACVALVWVKYWCLWVGLFSKPSCVSEFPNSAHRSS